MLVPPAETRGIKELDTYDWIYAYNASGVGSMRPVRRTKGVKRSQRVRVILPTFTCSDIVPSAYFLAGRFSRSNVAEIDKPIPQSGLLSVKPFTI